MGLLMESGLDWEKSVPPQGERNEELRDDALRLVAEALTPAHGAAILDNWPSFYGQLHGYLVECMRVITAREDY